MFVFKIRIFLFRWRSWLSFVVICASLVKFKKVIWSQASNHAQRCKYGVRGPKEPKKRQKFSIFQQKRLKIAIFSTIRPKMPIFYQNVQAAIHDQARKKAKSRQQSKDRQGKRIGTGCPSIM